MSDTDVQIKICGMTRQQDIRVALELGVEMLGLIFYEKSARAVNLEQARHLLTNLSGQVKVVAVVVNPEVTLVNSLLEHLPLDFLQFHGDESPEFCQQFAFPYIKAVAAHSPEFILEATQAFHSSSALLLDTPVPGIYGGSGQVFDWKRLPKVLDKPYILAGGLDAVNVPAALSQSLPFAVDVCSGVEFTAGIKDHNKMKDFVNAVRKKNDYEA